MRGTARSLAANSALTLLLACVALGTGCARYQLVGVYGPEGATVFVDGDEVGRVPQQVRVDRDQPHSIFVKKPSFKPQLVVLELNRAQDGVDYLTPADVSVRLRRRLEEPGEQAEAADDRDRDLKVEPEARP